MRKLLVVIGTTSVLALAAACGSGGSEPSVDVNKENCIDEEGRDICDAMGQEQIVVETTFTASFTEVTDSNGDPVGTLTSGSDVQIVCFTADSNWPEYGVVLTDEITSGQSDDPGGFDEADRFATGQVDNENFAPVGFILAEYVDGGEDLWNDLRPQLEERFQDPELRVYDCDDNRVVVTDTGKLVMTEQ